MQINNNNSVSFGALKVKHLNNPTAKHVLQKIEREFFPRCAKGDSVITMFFREFEHESRAAAMLKEAGVKFMQSLEANANDRTAEQFVKTAWVG